MKQLTLDETWTLCMEMWRWIVERIRQDPTLDVGLLKEEWLTAYTKDEPRFSCYFCEYNDQNREVKCSVCPAKQIDSDFKCVYTEYDYHYKPLAFYVELQRLHKMYKMYKMYKIKKK